MKTPPDIPPIRRTAADRVAAAMLLVVGVIHLLPVTGVLGGARLDALYGLAVEGPDLAILMRHRAVLFGLLGALLVLGAVRPAYRTVAFVAGFVSVVSFLALAWSVGGYNAALHRVVVADGVALVCLIVGAAAQWRCRRAP